MENIWEILTGLTALATFVLSIAIAYSRSKKSTIEDVKDDSELRSEMQMKIKELEGRIDGHYKELTTRFVAFERALTDNKYSNSAFETRVLTSVDKLESKIDRLQDLVLKTLINKQDE